MAATETVQIPLGFPAPEFLLPDTVSGNRYTFADLKGENATLVMFICNHCPYVIHVKDELVRLANDYMDRGVRCIAVSSNDVEKYPADAPDLMKTFAEETGCPFPYLYDESQEVAKAYFAACTPDFSLFAADGTCVYRGQLDDARPKNDRPVTGRDIRAALDDVLAGRPVGGVQVPGIGCNIKWKQ